MFLGHIAVGLAGKRAAPSVSLATWLMSVQFVDLLWPAFLLTGLEHVRIAPGTTAFTPLDFTDYPITHSLIGGLVWAALFAAVWWIRRRDLRVAGWLAAGVLSHWALDVISHRPDVPLFPHGPYLGLGLWNSVPATLTIELSMWATGLWLYARSGARGARRVSFWLLMAALFAAYLGAAFGPPPPDERVLAWSALSAWIFVPLTWWVDAPAARARRAAAERERVGPHAQ